MTDTILLMAPAVDRVLIALIERGIKAGLRAEQKPGSAQPGLTAWMEHWDFERVEKVTWLGVIGPKEPLNWPPPEEISQWFIETACRLYPEKLAGVFPSVSDDNFEEVQAEGHA
jgi:hypothetical protein